MFLKLILSIFTLLSFAMANECYLAGEEQVKKAIEEAKKRIDTKRQMDSASNLGSKSAKELELKKQYLSEIDKQRQSIAKKAQEKSHIRGAEANARSEMGHVYRNKANEFHQLGDHAEAIKLSQNAGDQFQHSVKKYEEALRLSKSSTESQSHMGALKKAQDNARDAYMNAGDIDKIVTQNLLPKRPSDLNDLANNLYNQAFEIRKKGKNFQSKWETYQMMKLGLEACKKAGGYSSCNPKSFEDALKTWLPDLERSI